MRIPERKELDDDPVLADLGVRMDYYKNYRIYYVVEDNLVIIVSILHMLVDSRTWLYRHLVYGDVKAYDCNKKQDLEVDEFRKGWEDIQPEMDVIRGMVYG